MTPGVVFLDHTADVGIDVRAADQAGLFHLAALGMSALLHGEEEAEAQAVEPRTGGPRPPASSRDRASAGETAEARAMEAGAPGGGPAEARDVMVEVEADGPATLLAAWLRELLFLHETRALDYRDADFLSIGDTALRARVRAAPGAGAVREIKGVTYHELSARRIGDRWEARVIFDV